MGVARPKVRDLGEIADCFRKYEMKDKSKTKKQLINELVELRQRIAELEASETEQNRAQKATKLARNQRGQEWETIPND